MDLYRVIAEVIDFRSFSNVWFWIALAVMWSMASHWSMGVAYDLIQRARRGLEDDTQDPQPMRDVEALATIYARRLLVVSRSAAVPLFFTTAFLGSTLLLLGFVFRIEVAQALSFLLLPQIAVLTLKLRTALKIEAGADRGAHLLHLLLVNRRQIQLIGICAIFVTALYGMWHNLNTSVLY